MIQHKIDEYQDAYCKAWDAQNKIDAKINKMVLTPSQLPSSQYNTEAGKQHGKMGGLKNKQTDQKLTGKAKIINNMMLHGMTRKAISSMMGESPDYIKKIESRFGLPRDV